MGTAMQLHFADDSQEQPVEIYHKLKLYDEADPNNPSTKKPVSCAAMLESLHDAPTRPRALRSSGLGPCHQPSLNALMMPGSANSAHCC